MPHSSRVAGAVVAALGFAPDQEAVVGGGMRARAPLWGSGGRVGGRSVAYVGGGVWD